MPSLKEVKSRIASVVSTQQITKAMKMVAAAKLRKSQERIMQMRPFAQKLNGLLQNLSSAGTDGPTWYNSAREEKKILIVAISSDRGLCGGFNSSVFKTAVRLIEEKYSAQHRQKNVTILPIGKKAMEYFTKRNFPTVADFSLIYQDLSFDKVAEAAQYLMDSFRKGNYDKIEIVYNEFKNVATQILRTEQFLPVLPAAKGKKTEEVDYIYQPDQEEIITGLIPKSLNVQLFKAVLDSNAAENGARMTAMDKATENAGELLKDLRLTYNRTRQAAITKEILEIVAGAEALKSA
ncbi:MAG: ATP synthase gamma chain [Cytophagales bacterium]|jgi:F-type H+-transporting ATPase subunit gamma|nr:ATP synthase F1 subunit gamma [Bacteroidota bacterium]MBS1982285.1 ATP synthase F1 subunit gamma [Bacteroidota bacterium]WHZ07619.1 MAG: ATP synthase gamma chain [Cytophagales bacterium]